MCVSAVSVDLSESVRRIVARGLWSERTGPTDGDKRGRGGRDRCQRILRSQSKYMCEQNSRRFYEMVGPFAHAVFTKDAYFETQFFNVFLHSLLNTDYFFRIPIVTTFCMWNSGDFFFCKSGIYSRQKIITRTVGAVDVGSILY